jgi:hypothetical protein
MKRTVAALVVALVLAAPAALVAPSASSASPSAWTVFHVNGGYLGHLQPTANGRLVYIYYGGGSPIGYLRWTPLGRWNIYVDYLPVGYMQMRNSGLWVVSVHYSIVGYSRLLNSHWFAFSKVGIVGSVLNPNTYALSPPEQWLPSWRSGGSNRRLQAAGRTVRA